MALTVKQAEDCVTEFCRQYRSALSLKYKIRDTQEELYGPQDTNTPVISAGYHPHRGIVAIPAANLRDDQELRRTLRHEIIGHYGLNTFVPDEKRKLLEAILRSRDEASMRPIWKAVEQGYPNASSLLKAEEVFAFTAERLQPSQRYDLAPGLDALAAVFNDDKATLDLRQLFAVTIVVASGLEQGTRLQQNFPTSDHALFSRKRTMAPQNTLGADGADLDSKETSAVESYHEKVAAKLIAQLKQGTAPWQRPIIPGSANTLFPYNPTTGANYRGMNMITLMASDRADPRWMTYKQAVAAEGQVRKGEKGTPIQYWSFTKTRDVLDAQGKPVRDERGEKRQETVRLARPLVRFATVFNAEQIDGLKETQRPAQTPTNTIERANALLAATSADIRHDQVDKMFYRPSTDTIHLPDPVQFRTAEDYYATAFHEIGHWTGHASRLDRDLSHPFGSEGYAKEELRAEIASLMISQELNLPHDPGNHASYVGSWIKALQDDPREIFRAASDAEKIRSMVMGMTQTQEHTMEPELPQPVQSAYQIELAGLLERSTLTPGSYTPSQAVKSAFHAAVFVNETPVILCGLNDDPTSIAQAEALAASSHIARLYKAAGLSGPITSGAIAGAQIPWQDSHSAVVSKPAGQVEAGADVGPLVAIVLRDKHAAITTNLCVTTETARILDANAPVLDDGRKLTALAGGDRQPSSAQERQYLNVPYAEKDEAKALGAKWDRAVKAWYVPESHDPAPFARWSQPAASAPRPDNGISPAGPIGPGAPTPAIWMEPRSEGSAGREELARRQFVPPGSPDRMRAIPFYDRPEFTVGIADERVGGALAKLKVIAFKDGVAELSDPDARPHTPPQPPPDTLKLPVERLVVEYQGRRVAWDEAVRIAETTSIDSAGLRDKSAELTLIQDSATLVRALALMGDTGMPVTQQLAKDDLQAYQRLPTSSVERGLALAIMGESATLDSTYAATLRVLDAEVAGAAQDAFQFTPDAGQKSATQEYAKTLEAPRRSYILVPYAEREQARAAGARWDANAKSWYVGPKADHEKLAKWDLAGQRAADSVPHPRQEFAARLTEAGARVTGDHPIMDGATHRIPVADDKPYQRSGFYVGHIDDIRPAGYFKNNRTGEEFRWKAKGYVLTDDQKAAFVAAASAKLADREAAKLARHEERAGELAARKADLYEVAEASRMPYLVAKNVGAYAGVFTDKQERTLFIPLVDVHGKQWSQQSIYSDGTKRIAKETRKEGCFHVVGGFDRLKDADVFVLAEGYSTAASIHECHGARVKVAVVAAVDSGNLTAVAKALRAEYPTTPIVIAADDDRALYARKGINPGRTHALAAAEAVNGVAVFPTFDPNDAAKLTDFNDLHALSPLGADGVQRQLGPVIDRAAGFEAPPEEKITKSRTRAIKLRAPTRDEEGPRRVRRTIA